MAAVLVVLDRKYGDVRDIHDLLNSECKRTVDNLCIFVRKGLKCIEEHYEALEGAGNLQMGATRPGL